MYWSILAPSLSTDCITHPLSMHLHLVSTALILTDIFVSAFPIRILHFVYPLLGLASYVIMPIVVYETGNKNGTSPFLAYDTVPCFANNDTENVQLVWQDSPLMSVVWSVALPCFGSISAQLILFFIYFLRINVTKILWRSDSDGSLDVVHISAITNYRDTVAFDTSVEAGQQFTPQPIDYFWSWLKATRNSMYEFESFTVVRLDAF